MLNILTMNSRHKSMMISKKHNSVDIHALGNSRDQVLLVLLNHAGEILSISNIQEVLVSEYKISIHDVKEVHNILQKDSFLLKNRLVHKHKNGYEIMRKGIDYLNETIIFIDPQNQSTTVQSIVNIFQKMSGTVRIMDPYFDKTAVEKLEHWVHERIKSIEIITEHAKGLKKTDLSGLKSSKTIEVRTSKKIHDRYIFNDNHLFYFGTSLNSIGSKQSYIFDMSNQLPHFQSQFNTNWSKSLPLA